MHVSERPSTSTASQTGVKNENVNQYGADSDGELPPIGLACAIDFAQRV